MTQLYPSYNGITRKIENIPVDQLSREYIESRYAITRIVSKNLNIYYLFYNHMTSLKDFLLEKYNEKPHINQYGESEEFESWHENISRGELADYFREYIEKISVSNIELSRVAEVLLDNQ